jgi:hypothetical protein
LAFEGGGESEILVPLEHSLRPRRGLPEVYSRDFRPLFSAIAAFFLLRDSFLCSLARRFSLFLRNMEGSMTVPSLPTTMWLNP